ncbi:MAG: PIN domain-containing protein [Gammaproteobacteria bacterium]|nr:PIN domain-containing protein [Gammaproteobacteria bacterium]
MTAAFLLDTSFLISLVDDSRPNHSAARTYFEHSLRTRTPLYVSTLALAEFAQKQAVTDLPLRTFQIVPFNILHASKSGELCSQLMGRRDDGDSRVAVRTDLQLIAQATSEGVPYILSEDKNTLYKYVERARSAGLCHCRTVLLADGFDEAWFNDGQKALDLLAQPKPEI